MLIGYDKDGEIKFYFTDDSYLKSQFPNNTAKVSNFWKVGYEGLTEMFIDTDKIEGDIKSYKVINGKLIKQEVIKKEQIAKTRINKVEPKIINIASNISNKKSEINKRTLGNQRSLNNEYL